MARVLIADDDERLREATRAVLESAGHSVIEASDGAEALRLLLRQQADVIVCDMFMQGQDGIETIRRLRRDHPALKIVAMSGGGYLGALDVLKVARHLGALEVLKKPFGRAELLDAIARATLAADSSVGAQLKA
jgi:CheY-like chemotaxis protein